MNSSTPLRKSPNSAFQSPHLLASNTTAAAFTPSSNSPLKTSLQPTLNELQQLQLDLPADVTVNSSAVSSVSLDTSVSPSTAAAVSPIADSIQQQLKIGDPSLTATTSSVSDEDGMGEIEESDRSRKPLHRVTIEALDLFRTCNPAYNWTGQLQPRRVLTSPSIPSLTNPFDNANNNLIMSVGDLLWHQTEDSHISRLPIKAAKAGDKKKYTKCFRVMELLGEGTFGQVIKVEECYGVTQANSSTAASSVAPIVPNHTSRAKVHRAVKVIKCKPAYYNQALMEIQILKTLNERNMIQRINIICCEWLNHSIIEVICVWYLSCSASISMIS